MKKLMTYVVALFAVAGQVAHAHTELSASMPADQAALDAAPKELMLHFSEPVRLTALSVQKQGESKQSLGPLPAEASPHFTVAAPALSEGQFMVSWRALSEDTHVMTGEFVFTVGAGAPSQQQPAQPEQRHPEHSETH
jgi:methionine-rich copper-binding protein CopC